MAISIKYLPEKASWIWDPFPKTRRFPLRCSSICDIDEEEAFAILVALAERNLVTLVKDARAGHVSLSLNLALHLNNR
ncbi:hypothetical protein LWI29_014580 [Acer saccharum]|uniref:Uncharacterized protein n=1 Tax=Acer saccharum TaxID=4024 RepID=A0AA39RLQ8_ACESA|nr:hypothetical protein LWI29_014580 [Acer saccharum]